MRADDLLAAVFPEQQTCPENLAAGDIHIPDHPLIREVMKDVLTEAMDVEGLERVLLGIESGQINCLAVDTPVASQFSHEILNANPYAYLDDAPLEERRARAVEMRRFLPQAVLEEIGRLDPAAIAEVSNEAWPDVRDAEELHDVLLTFIALPVSSDAATANERLRGALASSRATWAPYFDQLAADRRAGPARVNDRCYWVAAERLRLFTECFPSAQFEREMPLLNAPEVSREDAILACISGWMSHTGPISTNEMATALNLPAPDVDKALLRLEARGVILRGNFTGAHSREILSGQTTAPSTEWCERRLQARIHRLTLGSLRKEIQSVSPAQFMDWLLPTLRRARSSSASAERSKPFGRCKASKHRQTPGNARSCSAVSPVSIPRRSIIFV